LPGPHALYSVAGCDVRSCTCLLHATRCAFTLALQEPTHVERNRKPFQWKSTSARLTSAVSQEAQG
jgi:hypothetical protein